MKKTIIGIVGLSILLIAAAAFARPWGSCQDCGPSPEKQKFFEATRDLRKEMHDKRFQIMELSRSGAEQAKIDAVQKEIDDLRIQVQAKAQEFGTPGNPGSCAQNQGANCNQGKSCNGNQPCGSKVAGGCGNAAARCGR